MDDHPWFKFWSRDYLCDAKVDALSLEAQGFLVRMWCVCNQRGSVPNDPEEIARLTQCKLQSSLLNYPICKPFFTLRDGQLFSNRMESEKEKSRIARENASKRGKSNSSANGSTDTSAQKADCRKQKATSSSSLADDASALALTAGAVPAGPPVFITLLLNDNTEYLIDEKQISEWEALYQAVDVRQGIRNYKGWADANPTRRKTRRGILTSVNSWLMKEQDKFKPTGEIYGVAKANRNANEKQKRTCAAIQNAARRV